MGRLENKVAVVTGAGRGIGKGISLRFAAEGAKLVIGELDQRNMDGTIAEFIDTFVLSGRSGLPKDIASVAVFLASDDCTFVTGSTIMVDGGSTAALSF